MACVQTNHEWQQNKIPRCRPTHKLVCMVDNRNQKFILDQSLSEIEKQLDPLHFYRVNRKYLLNMNAIKRMKTYPKVNCTWKLNLLW